MENHPGQYRPESEKPKSTDPPKVPQKSTLSRAVEQTRSLYERNRWVFLPLGEAAKSSLGLPLNTVQEYTQPQPESAANRHPSPLEFQGSQVPQKRDVLFERELDKLLRGLVEQAREDETMPKIISPNTAQSSQPLEKQANTPEEVTAQERERQEIEASISALKQLRTMSQRIDYLVDPPLEHLHKLWQHDPEFMRPILTGLVKRQARIEKKARLYYRITEGDLSPDRKPDYSLLMDRVALWHRDHHADLMKLSQKDRDRLSDTEIDLFISTASIGEEGKSELAGVQNALVCMHDIMRSFQEAGVEPPKPLRQLYHRLEKRRAYLDPDHSKGSHL